MRKCLGLSDRFVVDEISLGGQVIGGGTFEEEGVQDGSRLSVNYKPDQAKYGEHLMEEKYWENEAMVFEERPACIIDNGGHTIKAGFAGDAQPVNMIPTMVGYPRGANPNGKDYYVGHEAQRIRDILAIKYPIEKRMITSWDEMEKIW